MKECIFQAVKDQRPLIHCITNAVTINDVANVLLSCGGRPIMADDPREVEEITSICGGLVINIGTLQERSIASMHLAGKKAAHLGHPIVLDPVGIGASLLRRKTVNDLVQALPITVIRGNASEIQTLGTGVNAGSGVDASGDYSLDDCIQLSKDVAQATGAIVVITGAIDVVSDGQTTYTLQYGHPFMQYVTGTGCMLSAVIGAYVTANRDNPLLATAMAVAHMGLSGEIAYERLQPGEGNGTYRQYILDAVHTLTYYKMSSDGGRIERV